MKRFKYNLIYIFIGLMAIWRGTVFLTERQFFFYPPQVKSMMNSPLFDSLIVLSGVLLIIYTLSKSQNNRLLGILLGVIVGLFTIVTFLEWEHLSFAGKLDWAQNVGSNLFVIAVTMWTAFEWYKR